MSAICKGEMILCLTGPAEEALYNWRGIITYIIIRTRMYREELYFYSVIKNWGAFAPRFHHLCEAK